MTGNSEAMGPGRRPAGPEVGFEEMAIDVLQARFRPTSGWPTTRLLTCPICNKSRSSGSVHQESGVFPSTNGLRGTLERRFCGALTIQVRNLSDFNAQLADYADLYSRDLRETQRSYHSAPTVLKISLPP